MPPNKRLQVTFDPPPTFAAAKWSSPQTHLSSAVMRTEEPDDT